MLLSFPAAILDYASDAGDGGYPPEGEQSNFERSDRDSGKIVE